MKGVADIGVIGLAVMGENLILNLESRGFKVACYNRTVERVRGFIQGRASGRNIRGCFSLRELTEALRPPRKILLMVRAGPAVDALIAQLLPYLRSGDILLDGGNSFYRDTNRRVAELEKAGILFVGMGVSGGEEGALKGPSLMPGGRAEAWPVLKDMLDAVAAKTEAGEPCCDWIGPAGAGHFVKMVHNGIEYGDMQLIAEAYHVMRAGFSLSHEAMSDIFRTWNSGVLDSYLIGITADILARRDEDGEALLHRILDAAGQKGTGRWTVTEALEAGQPLTLIAEAVFARSLSAMKEERVRASRLIRAATRSFAGDVEQAVVLLRDALYASKMVSYAQGFQLMRAASEHFDWALKPDHIARVWRGGCVIRSVFLDRIGEAFVKQPELQNLLLSPFFEEAVLAAQAGWRNTVAMAAQAGIPVPAMSAALAWFDGYRSDRLPANLLQAQRDYFGAHRYERTDRPRGEFHHTNWTGSGGETLSGSYSV